MQETLRRLALGCGAALLLAGTALAQGTGPIKLGALFPITGNGAQIGASGVLGVKLAVEEINKAGGIAGRQITLLMADDQLDTTQGVNEARRLIGQEHIEMLVGALSSQVALAVMPLTTEAKIPYLTHVGSSTLTPEVAPYGFSSSPPSLAQAIVNVEYLKDTLHAKNVGFVGDGGIFYKTWIVQFQDLLKPANIAITSVQDYVLGSTDMTPQLLALRRGNPDALIAATSIAPDLGYIQLGLLDIGWDVKLLGSTANSEFVNGAMAVAGPNAYKNTVGVQYKALTFCPGEANPGAGIVGFYNKVKAYDPGHYQQISIGSAGALYANVWLLKAAVEGTGGKTDGPSVAAWIETHGAGVPNMVVGAPEASKQSHFLYGANSLTIIQHPEVKRDGALQQRAGC